MTVGVRDDIAPNAAAIDLLVNLFGERRYEDLELTIQPLLRLYPNWLIGWKILSDTYMVQHKDARYPALQALELNINDPQEHCYYGLVLKSQGDLKGAMLAFRQAIALRPDYAAAYNNLAIVEKDMGDFDAAVVSYRRALALNPGYASCYSNLLFCLSHSENINTQALFAEHRQFASWYEAPLKAHWKKHSNLKGPAKILKVGFVSAAYREHSLTYFFEPVLTHLAQSPHLSLYAYCASALQDETSQRLQQKFHFWHNVDSLNDQMLAEKIRADGIDILVDLDGHTAGNRLLTFAMKPAPIQMTWLGYLATTGLTAMDYYLADACLLPARQFDRQFTEKIIQLPVNATFSPSLLAPSVNALPALRNGYLTFACFNRSSKITLSTVRMWCQILNAIPNAKMMLAGMASDGSYDNLLNWFMQNGIARERLILHPRTEMQAYLALHHQVDLCLDTFPSNGVTTTCHAAWMGVPTLCIEGDRLASRGAQALMTHLDLPLMIAANVQAYVTQACYFAEHLDELASLRQHLRERFNQSPLSKPKDLAASLEKVFRTTWKRWCAGKSVQPVYEDAY